MNARKKVLQASKLKGFSDWVEGFNIVKFGVLFRENLQVKKQGLKIYSISHEYEIEVDGVVYDVYKFLNFCSSKKDAEKQVQILKSNTRYGRKYPHGFEIDVVVDNYSLWSEGFDSY